MLDHIIITVENYAKSREFYEKALAPLGYQVSMEFGEGCGFSVLEKPDFWIRQGDKVTPHIHVAFTGRDHKAVDEFYAEAIAAGGIDNGAPGLRKEYHPNYYPDGHNIEAVCHRPQ